jgi:hypothetical protein
MEEKNKLKKLMHIFGRNSPEERELRWLRNFLKKEQRHELRRRSKDRQVRA